MAARSMGRLVTALTLGLALAWVMTAPALAAPIGASATARGMPWCGEVLWTGAKIPTTNLARKLGTVERIIDNVDMATDAATVVLMVVSGGVAVPAAAIKAVAKLGARMIIRAVKRLRIDLAKINRRKAGVRLRLDCVLGVVPYPSLGIYT